MKKLLILILLVVALGGAFLSRPTEADFEDYVTSKMRGNQPTDANDLLDDWITKLKVDQYIEECTLQNRFIYTVVRRNNGVAYVGLYSIWIPWSDDPATVIGDVQRQRDKQGS